MPAKLDAATRAALFQYLLRLGDDRLVLGHRLSEWCGHAPILEEDIALANIALDLIGQATLFLRLAGEVEGKGRGEAVSIWVVPSRLITASTPEDVGPFFDPGNDKPYRHPQFYKVPRGVRVF